VAPSPAAVAGEREESEPAMKKAMMVEEETVMEAMVKRKSIEMRAGEAAPHMSCRAAMEAAAETWTTDHTATAKMSAAAAKTGAAAAHATAEMRAAAAAMTAERRRGTRCNRRDAKSHRRRDADDFPPHELPPPLCRASAGNA
jgi:hypothetical protein